MNKKAPPIGTRLLQLGCFLMTLFLILQVIPRARGQRNTTKRSTAANPRDAVLYDQYNNPATQPPLGIGSQNFEPAYFTLDDQAADDFVLTTLPPYLNYFITEVRVMGEYSAGGGPASSFYVYFYTNAVGNLPGEAVAAFTNLPYTGIPPDFVIALPYPVSGGHGGVFWVSVQARQDFDPNGQWFWHNRTAQANAGAVWQNPADGYGTGCVTWSRKNVCMADQIWPDQVFQILGFTEGNPPTPRPMPTPRPRPTPAPRRSPYSHLLGEN